MKFLQKKVTTSENNFGKPASAFKKAALLSLMLGCSQTEMQEPSTGILLERYSGKITRDTFEDGTYSDPYQANRFFVKYKNPTTKEDAISFASSLSNTKIVGYMLPLNIFVYETSEDNRDPSIQFFSNRPEVDYSARVYYLYKKSSPPWDDEILTNSGSDLEKYGLWGVKKMELLAGLNLLDNVPMKPTTIAVLEPNGFYDINDPKSDIHYVPNQVISNIGKIYWNFGDNTGDLSDALTHGMIVSKFTAARNNGTGINGVASDRADSIFQIFPASYARADSLSADNRNINGEAGDQMQVTAALVHIRNFVAHLNIKVLNLSFHYEHQFNNNFCKAEGGVAEALGKLSESGVLMIAAVGNKDTDACNSLPSSLPNVISTGASKCSTSDCNKEGRAYKTWALGDLRWASNYSRDEKCLTIVAPGQDLLTYVDAKAELGDGTSYASPQVAGLAALITSVKPDADYNYVKRIMRENADPILLDDDPRPDLRDLVFYRINVRKTIEALLKELKGDTSIIPPQCKYLDSNETTPYNILYFGDAYDSNAVFSNLTDGVIYNFETGKYLQIPRDTSKYLPYSDFRMWDKDVIFHCALRLNSTVKLCKNVLGAADVEELTNLAPNETPTNLNMNYWNGNATYFAGPQFTIPKLYSHNYQEMRTKGVDVPGVSGIIPYLPIWDDFSPITLIYNPTILGVKLFLYDSKTGLIDIPIPTVIRVHSTNNSDIALFSSGKSVFNEEPLYKLDLTSRAITKVPISVRDISYGEDPVRSEYIPLSDGKFATFSAHDKKTVYVWDVNSGAKIFEIKIPDNEYFNASKVLSLKGGTLTESVALYFIKEASKGTRTYSCPIK